ncbi:uncharacterized protein [Musca autumnalis]|uniref:uncharacterized protein n=1 Tax=Musca autumnalis TaxID=221902 RepID=UPI003CE9209E
MDDSECIGKHFLPLDEGHVSIAYKKFKRFEFENFNAEPQYAVLANAEGSLIIRIDYYEGNEPIIYAGPLEEHGNYTLQQIFWYWLEKTESQNDLGDTKFPAELHLIFYHTEYPDLAPADKKSFGMMVFTFRFKVVEKTTFNFFETVSQYLPLIRFPFQTVMLPTDSIPSIEEIFKRNFSHFYSYHGSTCYALNLKDVVWFDFIAPMEIGVDFVQQVEYLEFKDGAPLMRKIIVQKPPVGQVFKSFGNTGISQDRMVVKNLLMFAVLLVEIL